MACQTFRIPRPRGFWVFKVDQRPQLPSKLDSKIPEIPTIQDLLRGTSGGCWEVLTPMLPIPVEFRYDQYFYSTL